MKKHLKEDFKSTLQHFADSTLSFSQVESAE